MDLQHIITQLIDSRAAGQAVTLSLLLVLLAQFVLYIRDDKTFLPIFTPPILITIQGIIFYSYVVIASPPPSAGVTTISWLLRFQTVLYAVFLMRYLRKRKRIES